MTAADCATSSSTLTFDPSSAVGSSRRFVRGSCDLHLTGPAGELPSAYAPLWSWDDSPAFAAVAVCVCECVCVCVCV